MKVRKVTAIVFEEEDGMVKHIAFSKTSAGIVIGLERFTNDLSSQKAREIWKVVNSANLPEGTTAEDMHYCQSIDPVDDLKEIPYTDHDSAEMP